MVDYLIEKVIGQLKAGGFGYLKVDYNETMGLGVDGGHSLGTASSGRWRPPSGSSRKSGRRFPALSLRTAPAAATG